MTNQFERAARAAKVMKLTTTALRVYSTVEADKPASEWIENLTDAQRDALVRVARVNPASAETWRDVVNALRDAEGRPPVA